MQTNPAFEQNKNINILAR